MIGHWDRDVSEPPAPAAGKVVPLRTEKGQTQTASGSQDHEAEAQPFGKLRPVPPPRLTQSELDALSRRLIDAGLE